MKKKNKKKMSIFLKRFLTILILLILLATSIIGML